jgi:hypothetical protein
LQEIDISHNKITGPISFNLRWDFLSQFGWLRLHRQHAHRYWELWTHVYTSPNFFVRFLCTILMLNRRSDKWVCLHHTASCTRTFIIVISWSLQVPFHGPCKSKGWPVSQFPPWEPRPLRQATPRQLQGELNSTHEIQLGVKTHRWNDSHLWHMACAIKDNTVVC